MEQQRSMFDVVFFRDLLSASLIFFLVAFAPLVGAIVFVFLPLPMLHYYLKHGRVKGFAILVFALVIAAIPLNIMNVPANTVLFAMLAGAGIMIAECLKRNYSVEKTIAYPVVAIFILSALGLLYQAFLANEAPWQLVKVYIDKQIRYSVNLYSNLQLASEQISFIKDRVPEIVASVTQIFPALFTVALLYMIWANMLAGRIISKKQGFLLGSDFGDLSSWKPPERMVWYFIAAGAILLLPGVGTEFVAWNVLVVISSIYLLAGLAIVSFFLKKSALPSAFRYLIYFLIFAQQIATLVVVAAGLFDLWVDFRKLNKPMEDSAV